MGNFPCLRTRVQKSPEACKMFTLHSIHRLPSSSQSCLFPPGGPGPGPCVQAGPDVFLQGQMSQEGHRGLQMGPSGQRAPGDAT